MSCYLSVLSVQAGMEMWFTEGVTGTGDDGAVATEAALTDLNRICPDLNRDLNPVLTVHLLL